MERTFGPKMVQDFDTNQLHDALRILLEVASAFDQDHGRDEGNIPPYLKPYMDGTKLEQLDEAQDLSALIDAAKDSSIENGAKNQKRLSQWGDNWNKRMKKRRKLLEVLVQKSLAVRKKEQAMALAGVRSYLLRGLHQIYKAYRTGKIDDEQYEVSLQVLFDGIPAEIKLDSAQIPDRPTRDELVDHFKHVREDLQKWSITKEGTMEFASGMAVEITKTGESAVWKMLRQGHPDFPTASVGTDVEVSRNILPYVMKILGFKEAEISFVTANVLNISKTELNRDTNSTEDS